MSTMQAWSWYATVPSESNPGDALPGCGRSQQRTTSLLFWSLRHSIQASRSAPAAKGLWTTFLINWSRSFQWVHAGLQFPVWSGSGLVLGSCVSLQVQPSPQRAHILPLIRLRPFQEKVVSPFRVLVWFWVFGFWRVPGFDFDVRSLLGTESPTYPTL